MTFHLQILGRKQACISERRRHTLPIITKLILKDGHDGHSKYRIEEVKSTRDSNTPVLEAAKPSRSIVLATFPVWSNPEPLGYDPERKDDFKRWMSCAPNGSVSLPFRAPPGFAGDFLVP